MDPIFAIVEENLDRRPGRYVPASFVGLLPSFRPFVAELPEAYAKTLVALMTLVTANGHVRPTLEEVARALGVPPIQARLRMEELVEAGIAVPLPREGGLDGYALAPGTFRELRAPDPPPEQPAPPRTYSEPDAAPVPVPVPAQPPVPAMAMSEAYAAMIGPPEQGGLGLDGREADEMMGYGLDRVARQLAWLPYRKANVPPAYFKQAVRHDYRPPRVDREGPPGVP